MFGILLLAYVVNAMNKVIFPVLIGDVRSDYGFSLEQAGFQSTIFALGIGLAGIPGGYLLTHLRRRTVIIIGTLTFSAATLATTFAFGFWDMLVWQTVAGIGESLQLTALLAIAAASFARRPSTAVGSVNVAFGVGAIVGPALGGHMLASFGTWRAPMATLAVCGFVAVAAVTVLVRPRFTEPGSTGPAGPGEPTAPVPEAGRLINHNTVVLSVVGVLAGLVGFGYIGMYPSFLQEHLGYSAARSGIVVGVSGVGALFSAFGGLLGDRMNPRTLLTCAYGITAAAGAALFAGPASFAWQLVWSLVFGLAFNAVVFVNVSTILIKSVTPDLCAKASGLFVTSLFVPAAFAGYLFSWLVGTSGWSQAGLIQIVGGSLIATALSALLRPKRMPFLFPEVMTFVASDPLKNLAS
ncbi:MFS transporter [Streptomyces sp. ISID311]|uniref:MFS transporter n=1 Tax=Streptomyces sp. ISID311 TaxID=2601673 RepID=UPI00164BE19A|nr:MFS transporter [Streptomyces sp. ISID311]